MMRNLVNAQRWALAACRWNTGVTQWINDPKLKRDARLALHRVHGDLIRTAMQDIAKRADLQREMHIIERQAASHIEYNVVKATDVPFTAYEDTTLLQLAGRKRGERRGKQTIKWVDLAEVWYTQYVAEYQSGQRNRLHPRAMVVLKNHWHNLLSAHAEEERKQAEAQDEQEERAETSDAGADGDVITVPGTPHTPPPHLRLHASFSPTQLTPPSHLVPSAPPPSSSSSSSPSSSSSTSSFFAPVTEAVYSIFALRSTADSRTTAVASAAPSPPQRRPEEEDDGPARRTDRWTAAENAKFHEICRGEKVTYEYFHSRWPRSYPKMTAKRFWNKGLIVRAAAERAAKKQRRS
jgi:hypothetical protein